MSARAGIGITLTEQVKFIRIGFIVDADLMIFQLLPSLELGLIYAGGFRAAVQLDMVLYPVRISFYSAIMIKLCCNASPLCLGGFCVDITWPLD